MYLNGMLPVKPTTENVPTVSSTYVEQINQKLIDHVIGADGTPLDKLPTVQTVTVAKTEFQANENGIPITKDYFLAILVNLN